MSPDPISVQGRSTKRRHVAQPRPGLAAAGRTHATALMLACRRRRRRTRGGPSVSYADRTRGSHSATSVSRHRPLHEIHPDGSRQRESNRTSGCIPRSGHSLSLDGRLGDKIRRHTLLVLVSCAKIAFPPKFGHRVARHCVRVTGPRPPEAAVPSKRDSAICGIRSHVGPSHFGPISDWPYDRRSY